MAKQTTEANSAPENWTKEDLLQAPVGSIDTTRISVEGAPGASAQHLTADELKTRLAALPAPPKDVGTVDLIVARPAPGKREMPALAELTVEGGLAGDRWASQDKYGPEYQLATTQTDYCRVVANGQPLEIHGDNLFLSLDLSADNLPIGSRLRLGQALVEVTPIPHNGCKKWVQRFGLAPMQLNMTPEWQQKHLRGIYLRVIEPGQLRPGDEAKVVSRPSA